MSTELYGKKVVLTRMPKQGEAMTRDLEALGAQVVSFPTIRLIAPPDESIIKKAIAEIDIYEWIIFTSVNAVDYFFKYLGDADASTLPKIAVVGPATEKALETHGGSAYMVAESFQQEGIVEIFSTLPHSAQTDGACKGKVLMPRSLEARDVLFKSLPKLGYELTVAPVYKTVQASYNPTSIAKLCSADAVVFTSPSTVRNFAGILDGAGSQQLIGELGQKSSYDFLNTCKVYSIGPVTSAELHKHPIDRDKIYMAAEATGASLVQRIAETL